MRTRRFANNERIRSKERRLLEVERRRESARTLSALPKGILGTLSHTTSGTTSTINTPLLALVDTASENWQVDFASVPDPTGGFDDINIEAGKQIAELAAAQVLSFTGQALGTYIVYATHTLANENPETRNPPDKYAGGTGVFPEHRTFFGHGQADGQPIPREGYDSTLSGETVSEAVDRLTVAYAVEASVPANATPLLSVVWDGSAITNSTVIARSLDFTDLYDHVGAGGGAHAVATTSVNGFMSAADKTKLDNHIGSGGNAHADATTSTDGFMSAADKAKLDAATANATGNTLAQRDGSGRLQVVNPSASSDAATKGYVDGAADASILTLMPQRASSTRIYAVRASNLPSGWSMSSANYAYEWVNSKVDVAGYEITITHNLNSGNLVVIPSVAVTNTSVQRVPWSTSVVMLSSTQFKLILVPPTRPTHGVSPLDPMTIYDDIHMLVIKP